MSHPSATPPWPSLYNIIIEIAPIEHRGPVQPGGHYLSRPSDIYRFTLYWTLVFNIPLFILCGTYAFFNLTFAPSRPHRPRPSFTFQMSPRLYSAVSTAADIPMQEYNTSLSPQRGTSRRPKSQSRPPWAVQHERRSRLTFALIVFLTFTIAALGGAVICSAIVGYVLAGLFKAANYHMSTWIPFLGGLIPALVSLLGLWPSVIDII